MQTFEDFGIKIRHGASGDVKTTCPNCRDKRKNKNDLPLSVNVESGVWNCHNCGHKGGLKTVPREEYGSKKYRKPTPPKTQSLSQDWIAWLSGRGITESVWSRNKVYSSSLYVPQLGEEAVCIHFPYYRGGELVNIKHRDHEKNFFQEKEAELVLYGIDDIDDAVLVWVEGEMDKLSVEVAGFKSCVSVPAGAPGENDKTNGKKFEFFEASRERFKNTRLHVIAVDNDGPGYRLQQELIRRLGPENCATAIWPDGCKDANDVLKKHGAEELFKRISGAKHCPIKGVLSVNEISEDIFSLYEHGSESGLSTGWKCIDEFYTVRPGEWTVVTGIPGHGKSEWLDALLLNMAHLHGWKFAMFSPENQPTVEHIRKLLEKAVDKPFSDGPTQRMSPSELMAATAWLNDRFFFVVPEEPTLEKILELGKNMVRRWGINGMVVDPWNEIDHCRPFNMTETEYISSAISQLRRFAREAQIHLWLVAHPTKLQKDRETGKYPCPSLYDISGSAHWRNKADNGIAVFRHMEDPERMVDVHIQKIRFKAVGRVGVANLKYDRVTGRYKDPNSYFSQSLVEVAQ